MSKYYVVFERPDGDKVLRDGYVFEFEHKYPTEEELIKAMNDVLGGTDKGTIIFMQKLYNEFVEAPDDLRNAIGSAIGNLAQGEEKTDAEQQ